MKIIDLRSDTVTQPTQAMRDAMRKADVGDDVYGEDPTINKLEEVCAERLGKEAALFVASGTMGNLVSLLSHCGRADQIIVGDHFHIARYERGGMAALAGIFPRILTNHSDGTLPLDRIKAAISPEDPHFGPTRLICLENTFNGRVLDSHYVKQVSELARANSLLIHLDGARLFNAAIAQNVKVSALTENVDSVQICFSKGLAAPVGSLVAGSKQFIKEARNMRKMIGGGMRQAGVIAAACLVALETMVSRLKEDHDNAAVLAAGLSDLKGLVVDSAETNMVFASVTTDQMNAAALVERLAAQGVKVLATSENTIRIVTHYGIEAADIATAISAFHNVLNEPGRMQAAAGRPA